jgi:hypothetical protein
MDSPSTFAIEMELYAQSPECDELFRDFGTEEGQRRIDARLAEATEAQHRATVVFGGIHLRLVQILERRRASGE